MAVGAPEAEVGGELHDVEEVRCNEIDDGDEEVPARHELRRGDRFKGQRAGGEDHREDDEGDLNDAHDEVDLDEFGAQRAEVNRVSETGARVEIALHGE